MPLRDPDYDLWLLLAQTRHAMSGARQKEVAKYNITGRQAAVLHILNNVGYEATPARIARWLLRQDHTVFEGLKRMEQKGLIRRVKDLKRRNMIRSMRNDGLRKIIRIIIQVIHFVICSVFFILNI